MRITSAVLAVTLAACGPGETALRDGGSPPPSTGDRVVVDVLRDVVLRDDVRFPEADPALSNVELAESEVVLTYASEAQIPIEPGHVILGATGDGYLRRVTEIETLADGRVRLTTEPAALEDVYLEGSFRITVSSTPVDEASTFDAGIGGSSEPLVERGEFSLVPAEWRDAGFPCEATVSDSLTFEPELTLNRELTLEASFSGGTLDAASVIQELSLGANLVTGSSTALNASCTIDLIGAVNEYRTRRGQPPFQVQRVTWVALPGVPFPVPLTHTITPILELGLTLDVHGSYRLTQTGAIGGRFGVAWDRATGARWIEEPVRTASATLDVEAEAMLSAGATRAGLRYDLMLLGLAGPNVALTGSLVAHANADAVECSWETYIEVGGSLDVGFRVANLFRDEDLLSLERSFALEPIQLLGDSGPLPWCRDGGGIDPPPPDMDAGIDAGPDAGTDAGAPPSAEFINATCIFDTGIDGTDHRHFIIAWGTQSGPVGTSIRVVSTPSPAVPYGPMLCNTIDTSGHWTNVDGLSCTRIATDTEAGGFNFTANLYTVPNGTPVEVSVECIAGCDGTTTLDTFTVICP